MTKKPLYYYLSFTMIWLLASAKLTALITLLKNYQNNRSAAIGAFQGINFREGGEIINLKLIVLQ